MPTTTFNIPPKLLSRIDKIVRSRKARNRREIVVRALERYFSLEVYNWTGPFIFVKGLRDALVSRGSIQELVANMSDQELYDSGKRMGKALRDWVTRQQMEMVKEENRKAALQAVEDLGWGQFSLEKNQITITESFFPVDVIRGYLETGLSIELSQVSTTNDNIIFRITSD